MSRTARLSSKHYDATRERAWHLSLLSAPGHHAWAVHDLNGGSCVALHASDIDRLPDAELLPTHPLHVTFTVLPEISALVPESALVPGSGLQHLKFTHGTLPTGMMRDEPVEALGARCVYMHDEQAEQRLLERFPSARPVPMRTIMLTTAMARSMTAPVILAHRAEKRLDIAIARNGQLLLSNTFHAVTPEDVLYFLLFTLDHVKIGVHETQVLHGGTHLNAAEVALLERYCPQCAPAIAGTDPVTGVLRMEAPQQWMALLNQFTCAS